ncbi:MAG: hypothetical protein R3E66_04475 [bacterium]
MNLTTKIGDALGLTRHVWMETLLFAVVLTPVFWGLFEIVGKGGNITLLRYGFAIPQALFTGFSAVVLFQAFENHENGTEVELPTSRLMQLSFLIAAATFIVNLIVGIGTMFCVIPGVIATVGLYLTQITMFKEDTGVLGSIFQSWSLTLGHRLEIFLLLVMVGIGSSVVIVPLVAGLFMVVAARHDGGGMMLNVAVALGFGVTGAFALTFSRALEYTVYSALSSDVGRWTRPTVPQPEEAPEMAFEPQAPARQPERPPVRGPITVDQDIVFGQDADDDNEQW